jgi:hypothetical protein
MRRLCARRHWRCRGSRWCGGLRGSSNSWRIHRCYGRDSVWQARREIRRGRLRFRWNLIDGLACGRSGGRGGNRFANRRYLLYPAGTMNFCRSPRRFRGRAVTNASSMDRAAPGTECRLRSLVDKLRLFGRRRLNRQWLCHGFCGVSRWSSGLLHHGWHRSSGWPRCFWMNWCGGVCNAWKSRHLVL